MRFRQATDEGQTEISVHSNHSSKTIANNCKPTSRLMTVDVQLFYRRTMRTSPRLPTDMSTQKKGIPRGGTRQWQSSWLTNCTVTTTRLRALSSGLTLGELQQTPFAALRKLRKQNGAITQSPNNEMHRLRLHGTRERAGRLMQMNGRAAHVNSLRDAAVPTLPDEPGDK